MTWIQKYCKCEKCNEYFPISGKKSPARRYCSQVCRPLRKCEWCGKLSKKREDAKYCSDACRQKAYRKRLNAS